MYQQIENANIQQTTKYENYKNGTNRLIQQKQYKN